MRAIFEWPDRLRAWNKKNSALAFSRIDALLHGRVASEEEKRALRERVAVVAGCSIAAALLIQMAWGLVALDVMNYICETQGPSFFQNDGELQCAYYKLVKENPNVKVHLERINCATFPDAKPNKQGICEVLVTSGGRLDWNWSTSPSLPQ